MRGLSVSFGMQGFQRRSGDSGLDEKMIEFKIHIIEIHGKMSMRLTW